MNRSTRLTVAALLVGLLVLTAAGVWAAPKFQGTVPPPPDTGGGTCAGGTVDMGTALFTPQGTECTISVDRVGSPDSEFAPAPAGLAFVGDTFKVTIAPEGETVNVCYAYPPEFAAKEAKLYKLNEEANPPVWVEVPGAVIANGTICVSSTSGVFSLIGNP